MKSAAAPARDLSPRFVRAMIGFIVLLFLVRNLPWHLDNYDQAKQAFTSFEMVQEGNLWFQHTPSGRVATKPPLAGWISTGLYFLMGGNWWDVAWRIPPLASALLLLWLLWRSGTALLDGSNIGGLIAAGAFGLNAFSPRLATLVRTDMMLTLLIFLTGWLIWKKVRSGEPWSARERWMLCLLVLGSMLTKGPIAYAFLLPGLVAFAFLTKGFRLANHSWSGWWTWLLPLLAFGAWAWIGMRLSPEFYDQVVQKEFLGRFTVGEKAVHNNQIVLFYLGHLLLRLAPWSLLLLACLAVKEVRAAFRTDRELLWLACWTLGGLIFMSLVPSKRFDRILPVVPPLCMLIVAMARHLPQLHWRGTPLRKLAMWSAVIACLASGAYAGAELWKNVRDDQGGLARFGRQVAEHTDGRADRLAVISGKDEGLLLYTNQTRFTRTEDAIDQWRSNAIDWLVLPLKVYEKEAEKLAPFDKIAEVPKLPEKGSGYAFLGRSRSPAAHEEHKQSPLEGEDLNK